jgi:hypothetical protein
LSAPLHRLLISALLLPEPQAGEAWRGWRAAANLDRLDPASFHLLPGLASRLPEWTSQDPRSAVLLGICRRAWSQNQLRSKLLAEALEIWRSAGIERVAMIGPLAWGALYWPERSIRTAPVVDALVQPSDAWTALQALVEAKWIPQSRLPDRSPRAFPFEPAVLLRSASGGELRLHWRALPNDDFSLRRPPVPMLIATPPGHVARYTIPPEYALVAALGDPYNDALDWQCDAILISRKVVDWVLVAALLRWRAVARSRLTELCRDWSVGAPAAAIRSPWTSGVERLLAGSLRSYRRVKEALWGAV